MENTKLKCPYCNQELIWLGDESSEDVSLFIEFQSNYTCVSDGCEVQYIVSYKEEKENY